jgi:hypothetical protein
MGEAIRDLFPLAPPAAWPVCPACKGTANVAAYTLRGCGASYDPLHPCGTCTGLGRLSPEREAWWQKGRAHRMARVGRMESLAECAQRLGLTPVQLSALENGRKNPEALPDA